MKIKVFLTALLMLAAGSALAAARANIEVEGVQTPAWVERAGGAREPLAIGMAIANKDRIFTGPGARALLRLADGSLISLGENGVLALDDLGQSKINLKEVVTASLDVVSGAFRFTTRAVHKFRGERDVRVKLAATTAGIRGTDLWGKSEPTRDIFCLVEGSITVAAANDAFTMDQPMSFYIAPRNAPALPVTRVSQQQLDEWSAETALTAGAGALRQGGLWKVQLAEANNQNDALAIYDRLRDAGYAAEIRPLKSAAGPMIYRVRIAHLPSRQEAEALAGKLKGRLGITGPKVSR